MDRCHGGLDLWLQEVLNTGSSFYSGLEGKSASLGPGFLLCMKTMNHPHQSSLQRQNELVGVKFSQGPHAYKIQALFSLKCTDPSRHKVRGQQHRINTVTSPSAVAKHQMKTAQRRQGELWFTVWEEMQCIVVEKTRTSNVVTTRPQSGHM